MQPVRITLVRPLGDSPGHVGLLPHEVPEVTHDWGIEATWRGMIADPDDYRANLRRHNNGWDAAVVTGPLAERPPKVLVMDVDSTLITAEVIDLLAEATGSGAQVAAITERAMRGELDFGESLRERVATLRGLSVDAVSEVIDRIEFSPGARTLISAAKASGCLVGVVSGGFIEVVQHLADTAGIDIAVANHLEVADGRLTGKTSGEIIDRAAKLRHTRHFAELAGARLDEVVAVGDGANDLDMLGAVGLGIAYCAKPLAAAQASATVSFPRLDAVRALAGLGDFP